MKIGILAYRQYPYISANTAIAYTVGDCMEGHEVVYIGRKQDDCQNNISEYHGKKIRFLNVTVKMEQGSRFKNVVRRVIGDEVFLLSDAQALKKIVCEEKIEAIICVIAPNDNASIVLGANLNIPTYIYQLDPFYNSFDRINESLKKKFLKLLSKTDHLFTTDLLYEEYRKDKEVSAYLSKISVVQFPKLISPNIQERRESFKKKVVLLYAGTLYHKIRNPQIMVDLKNCLSENFELIFCGSCDEPTDMQLLKEAGIICKGYCSQEILANETENADILINIGNLVRNQLGSKIIDYIATGKPILNIIQFAECPTVNVLKEYDLKFNISVAELQGKQHANEMKVYLETVLEKRIPFSEIQQMYIEYTPQFVAKTIIEQITDRQL